MKILNFGSCNIDYVYSLEHIVRAGETETTHKLETFPGGKGLNQSIAVSKAGVEVFHAGCVGYDGDMLIDVLSESNVDVSYVKKTKNKNGHAIIQVSDDGENSIFLYPGSNEEISKDYIDVVLKNFSNNDIIILQNEISNVDYIIREAYLKGMCIILNPAPFNQSVKKIDFNMLSYVLLNEIEACDISGCNTPEESLTYLNKLYPDLKIVLTMGDKGCIYMDNVQKLYQPAFVVDVVDTTAAGDTFTGYFVAGVSRKEDLKTTLKIASAASALAVSQMGAAPSILARKKVLTAIDSLQENESNIKSEFLKKQIEMYVNQNIKDASLAGLSVLMGYSTVYTGILVKNLTGETFSSYIQKKRCDMAAKMLLNTDLSIQEIISSVGYENESFFRKVFKEKYGQSPLKFRKQVGVYGNVAKN